MCNYRLNEVNEIMHWTKLKRKRVHLAFISSITLNRVNYFPELTDTCYQCHKNSVDHASNRSSAMSALVFNSS